MSEDINIPFKTLITIVNGFLPYHWFTTLLKKCETFIKSK